MTSNHLYIAGNQKKLDLNPDGPYIFSSLFKKLLENGYLLTENCKAKAAIFIDYDPLSYSQFISLNGNPNSAVLLRFEPENVLPSQYKKEIYNKFGLVLDFGRDIEGRIETCFPHPYQHNANPLTPAASDVEFDLNKITEIDIQKWHSRSNKFVLIASNKIPLTSNSGYFHRTKLLRQSLNSKNIIIFGKYWKINFQTITFLVRSIFFHLRRKHNLSIKMVAKTFIFKKLDYRGVCNDKHEILRNTQFNVVIENTFDTMTEKILDSIFNGAIPIYMGPNNRDTRILEGCFIRLSNSADIDNLVNNISNLDKRNIEEILLKINDGIVSRKFIEHFAAEAVMHRASNYVISHLREINDQHS